MLQKPKQLLEKFSILLTIFVIGLIYILRIPSTVQSGDTGELISAAWGLFVPHPPGYPLFTWLYSGFIHAFDYNSVFWRAALLNVFISLSCLYCLGTLLKENKLIAVAGMLLLAFSRVYWKYSLLPDVFILNALMAAAILLLYFKDDGKTKRSLWIPFLFALGLTNHLTLVFLIPIVIDVMWARRKQAGLYAVMALGTVTFVGLYASLMWLHPEHLHSWGLVTDMKAVLAHILRLDYGTFKLVNSAESGGHWVIWKLFFSETAISFYSLILLLGFGLWKLKKAALKASRKNIILWISVLLYPVVFFSLSNTNLDGFRADVIERFFILFQVVFVFCGMSWLLTVSKNLSPKMKSAIAGLIVVSSALSFFINYGANNFSKNTVIEDYTLNFLREAPAAPTVLLVHSDTRFFALRYAQNVLGYRPEVNVVAAKMLFFPWFSKKFVHESGTKLDLEKLASTNRLELESDFILPNLEVYSFLTIFDFPNTAAYSVKYMPLGRLITQGKGVSFATGAEAQTPFRISGKDLQAPLDKYDVSRDLWSDYCQYPLALSSGYVDAGDMATAIGILTKAAEEIPWCIPAVRGLCLLREGTPTLESTVCAEVVKQTSNKYYPYFGL